MEGLGAAAGVIAVVHITGKIFDLCQGYYSEVKDARIDIRRLRDQVTSLQDILIDLKDLVESSSSGTLSSVERLVKGDGQVQQCKKELQDVAVKLEEGQGKDQMRKLGKRALKWPFSKKKVDEVIQAVEKWKTTFSLALNVDQATIAIDTKDSITELKHEVTATRGDIIDHAKDEDRTNVIQWLATTDPTTNHDDACKRRQPTTGEWFLQRSDFQEWKMKRNSLLWLFGKPGCGKTVLSSTIIEHLQELFYTTPRVAVIYFYFDFNDQAKQNAADLLSSLLAQLCHRVLHLPTRLKELHKSCNYGKHRPTVRDLKPLLAEFAVHGELDDVLVVADALDESPRHNKSECRSELLKLITEIKNWSESKIHLLITSRPELDIEQELTPLLMSKAIAIEGSHMDSDIKLHIGNELAKDPKLAKWPDQVKVEIEETLTRGANGMFRWVFCQLDALQECKSKAKLLRALRSLPTTLDDTYARILDNIDEEYKQPARRALLWLAFSERPLYVKEVAEAAMVDPRSEPPFDPEERFIEPRDNILEILGSLVTTSSTGASESEDNSSTSPDEELRLAHFSVKEYLVSERIQQSAASEFGTTEITANPFIAESCLAYFFEYCASESKISSDADFESFPLLNYACRHWYIHARSTPPGSCKVESLTMRLFMSEVVLRDWLAVHRPDRPWEQPFRYYLAGDDHRLNDIDERLHYAAHLGLYRVVQVLLENGAEVRGRYADGQTPLDYAIKGGHEAVAELLLNNGADVRAKDVSGSTALHRAAGTGQEKILKLLLDRKADIDAKHVYGRTALHEAADSGYERIMQLLLDHGADIDAKEDSDGCTALHKAAFWGRERAMQLLLDRKANIDAKDIGGRTALHRAGYERVVQLLLDHKADIDAKDVYGCTALHRAATAGNERVVQLLLDRKACIDVKDDDDGRTALHQAASQGHGRITQLLLDHGADIDGKDDSEGCTALHQAAFGGYERVVQLLLDRKANIDAKDIGGRTALHQAGYERVVQLLLDHKADIDVKNVHGCTALHWAASQGYERVVQLLLSHGAGIDAKDNNGRTALHRAACFGRRRVVQLLLGHGADVDMKDVDGLTALHEAAIGGYERVVQLLLGHGADVDMQDNDGDTAQDVAVKMGENAIAKLLQDHRSSRGKEAGRS